jgi:MHS family proline/betaine transporter-like MFS transporter
LHFPPSNPTLHLAGFQMAAATVGGALEAFDILMYGYLAVVLSSVFFPARNSTVSLLLVFGSFGLSYVVRPLGAAVLGGYADRRGRKKALTLSIQLMMAGTATMALMPPFASIGIVAAIGVFVARLLQGFSVGGEIGSSTAFMVEQTKGRKGLFGSWQAVSANSAKLLSSFFGIFLTTAMSPAQLSAWGWRVPFLFGLLIGPVGLYIRRHVQETPEFVEITPLRAPVRQVLSTASLRLFLAVGVIAVPTAITYFFLYLPTFVIQQLKLPPHTAFYGGMLAPCIGAVVNLTLGHLSDKVGRLRIMLPVTLLALLSVYPVFALLVHNRSIAVLLLTAGWLGFINGAYCGPMFALISEIFPTQFRSTGMSLSYNVGVTAFGGFAPFAFTSLVALTRSGVAPSFYLAAMAFVSMLSLIVLRRRFGFR